MTIIITHKNQIIPISFTYSFSCSIISSSPISTNPLSSLSFVHSPPVMIISLDSLFILFPILQSISFLLNQKSEMTPSPSPLFNLHSPIIRSPPYFCFITIPLFSSLLHDELSSSQSNILILFSSQIKRTIRNYSFFFFNSPLFLLYSWLISWKSSPLSWTL